MNISSLKSIFFPPSKALTSPELPAPPPHIFETFFANKANFASLGETESSVLEIGPFNNPMVRGGNVSYFDVMTTDQLRKRAVGIGYDTATIPEINFVSPIGDLSVVEGRFSAVVSSHCIEHQPDLIHHLAQVHALLEPGGKYYLVVPDKRYCFDHFLPEVTLGEVLAAKGETVHPLHKVIEHRALTTHNDPHQHWNGVHQHDGWAMSTAARVQSAIDEYNAAEGGYVDVHRWQFTPETFRAVIEGLTATGQARFEVVEINQTPRNTFDFTAILRAV
ncbi:methyltransferase domain-containing protein [Mesorhizobium sp. NBSH29]|uniref:methyltransferase domain-containing protein n=1 Tax=Mesorhizobium sp. NBSH29 TaxID=2654249 RepID=UPI00189665DA|nr:methyltransferase domain-containing protein [Mesorhizobium sp. NBSH29]QPC87462.1 methyltransferase domain-containing protein [Mesorhizobium sp. NBSH29]